MCIVFCVYCTHVTCSSQLKINVEIWEGLKYVHLPHRQNLQLQFSNSNALYFSAMKLIKISTYWYNKIYQ
jgi:hypothetical protein